MSLFLPHTARPSFAAGFARSAAEAANPWAWDGLVFHQDYRLGATGQKAFDVSGRHNDGILVAMDGSNWSKDGIKFDNPAGGHITSSLTSFADPNYISASVWFYNSATALDYRTNIFGRENTAGAVSIEVGTDAYAGTRTMRSVIPGYYTSCTVDNVINIANKWYHVVYTRSGSGDTHAWYIDGLLAARQDASSYYGPTQDYVSSNIFVIGRRASASQYFDGCLSNLSIYNRVLTPSEIRALHDDSFAITRPAATRFFTSIVAEEEATTTTSVVSIPSPSRPSFAAGFARSAAEAANPWAWDGLVFHQDYRLGATGSKAFDVSGRHNDGTLTNMDGSNWTAEGLTFNAADQDGYSVGPVFAANAKITLATRVNFSSFAVTPVAIGSYKTYEAALGASGSKPWFLLNSFFTHDRVTGTTTLNANEWYSLVGVYDGSSLSVYLDGRLENSVTPTGTWIGATAWDIGGFLHAAGFAMAGKIANASIYNRALTPSEIKALHEDSFAITRPAARQYSITSGAAPAAFSPWWARRQFNTIGGGLI